MNELFNFTKDLSKSEILFILVNLKLELSNFHLIEKIKKKVNTLKNLMIEEEIYLYHIKNCLLRMKQREK